MTDATVGLVLDQQAAPHSDQPGEQLARVTAAMPAGEERAGQRTMVDAVASAIQRGRHLVVQAGTGTGKTLGYLIPVILSDKRTVVATATN